MNSVLILALGFSTIETPVFVDPLSFWELESNGANLSKLHAIDPEAGEFHHWNGWYCNGDVCSMDD